MLSVPAPGLFLESCLQCRAPRLPLRCELTQLSVALEVHPSVVRAIKDTYDKYGLLIMDNLSVIFCHFLLLGQKSHDQVTDVGVQGFHNYDCTAFNHRLCYKVCALDK